MARGHGGRRRGGHQEEESGERWLLTYADMITLLMALFMVLFSISSVNISKYQTLQESLRAAFSGNILPGGRAIAKPGASSSSSRAPSSIDVQAVVPVTPTSNSATQISKTHAASTAGAKAIAAAAQQQASEFAHIKQELDRYAAKHGFSSQVKTSIESRGLVIRVLTDQVLFASGQANLDTRAFGLLVEIGALLNVDETHPIAVEGNTDDVPIHSARFASNWELSTARASTVVRFLIAHQVEPSRLSAAGFAEQDPIASNATATGRARNRRVEIVLQRVSGTGSESE
ncbi:MAG TPA: flagellar motor protein MotB [Solirubrobacteraceae bacterium]|nr:flagellar motor protein MotB [Solirubrobacteraceae bacterium]